MAITLCSYSHKLSLGPHPPSEDNQRDGGDDNAGNADQDPEATLHALAGEILRYREALRLLADAVGWASAGAPFGFFPPGPLWRPRRTGKDDVVPPAA